jgi:hypothetical protein
MMYVSDLCPVCGVDGLVLDDQEGRVPYHLDGRVRRVWEVLTVQFTSENRQEAQSVAESMVAEWGEEVRVESRIEEEK